MRNLKNKSVLERGLYKAKPNYSVPQGCIFREAPAQELSQAPVDAIYLAV